MTSTAEIPVYIQLYLAYAEGLAPPSSATQPKSLAIRRCADSSVIVAFTPGWSK